LSTQGRVVSASGGFIVTNLSLLSRVVVRFYNKRGTAEQWIKEGKQATHWTGYRVIGSGTNEARLQLSLLAYNLGNLWRRIVLPKRIDAWSRTSLQQRLVQDWWAAGQACPLLLAAACRRASASTPLWPDAAADLCAAAAERVAHRLRLQNLGPREEGWSSV